MATPTLLSAQDLSTAGIFARWHDQLYEIADIGSKDRYGVRVEVFLHEPGGWWCYWVPLEEVTLVEQCDSSCEDDSDGEETPAPLPLQLLLELQSLQCELLSPSDNCPIAGVDRAEHEQKRTEHQQLFRLLQKHKRGAKRSTRGAKPSRAPGPVAQRLARKIKQQLVELPGTVLKQQVPGAGVKSLPEGSTVAFKAGPDCPHFERTRGHEQAQAALGAKGQATGYLVRDMDSGELFFLTREELEQLSGEQDVEVWLAGLKIILHFPTGKCLHHRTMTDTRTGYTCQVRPLLCRKRQERRFNPPFSPRLHSKV